MDVLSNILSPQVCLVVIIPILVPKIVKSDESPFEKGSQYTYFTNLKNKLRKIINLPNEDNKSPTYHETESIDVLRWILCFLPLFLSEDSLHRRRHFGNIKWRIFSGPELDFLELDGVRTDTLFRHIILSTRIGDLFLTMKNVLKRRSSCRRYRMSQDSYFQIFTLTVKP